MSDDNVTTELCTDMTESKKDTMRLTNCHINLPSGLLSCLFLKSNLLWCLAMIKVTIHQTVSRIRHPSAITEHVFCLVFISDWLIIINIYYCTFSFWLLALMILAANVRPDEFSMHLWTCPKRPLIKEKQRHIQQVSQTLTTETRNHPRNRIWDLLNITNSGAEMITLNYDN